MKPLPKAPVSLARIPLATFMLLSLWSPHLRAQAQAQDPIHPLSLQVDETVSYDSNPYRLASGVTPPGEDSPHDRSDFFSATQARMQYTYQGEGHNLNLRYVPAIVRYRRFSQLDHVRQTAGVRWAVTPAERLSIVTAYLHSRLPSNLADQQTPTPNMVTSDILSADVAFGGRGQWQLTSGVSGNTSKNSDSSFQVADREGWGAYAGVKRIARNGSTIDLRYRHSRQRYPNGSGIVTIDSGYRQNELISNWDWRPSGISQLSGQISYQTRKHDTFPQRDFQGWAGNARYTLSFDALSAISLEAYRQLGEISEASASYAKINGVRVSYAWKPSVKLTLTPTVDWRHREYNSIDSIRKPNETTRTFALSSSYAATPSLTLNTTIGTESRKSQADASRYSATYANMQLVWAIR